MADLYQRVLAVESPRVHKSPDAIDAPFWGRLADVVSGHYAQKAARLAGAAEWLTTGGNWDRVRGEIAPMLPTPQRIADCLAAAGAARRAEDIGCDSDRLLAAFGHAHEIRARFTILDLAHLLGILPGAAEEIVSRWA